ncbi:MAG: Dol-P-Glc:Glc(2)Man(9)GlcNAc(2)-PP-Dol alpha-1,2-glucosyltransferase [Phycisphaerales bacterium]|nr:Dol-P-Glc:Glc(2)Man(9)GlcNAc(2)-PP-Dol alpha-1,2-glucosyltransferase [Phycisphaerales bacterium]
MPVMRATGIAIGSIVLWFCVLTILHPRAILDERQHHDVIQRFAQGDWRLPPDLPMLPTYHALAALASKVFGSGLTVARAVTSIMAICTVLLFAGVVRSLQPTNPGEALLHFAWLPLMFTFTSLAYTDMATVLCVVAGILLHVRRRYAWSAVMLAVGCLVRQSTIVWLAFMAVWTVINLWQERADASSERCAESWTSFSRDCLKRVWGHCIVLGLALLFFVYNRGLTLGDVPENHPRFNLGQFLVFALFVLGLWAPVWISRARDDVRALALWVRTKPGMSAIILIIASGIVATMAASFENAHPWNQAPSILRNRPLRLMADSAIARSVGCVTMLIAAALVARFTREQPARLMLTIVWIFSVLFLLPHSLVEPRYYILPVCLTNLLTRYPATQSRNLAIWYLSLCIISSVGIFFGTIW